MAAEPRVERPRQAHLVPIRPIPSAIRSMVGPSAISWLAVDWRDFQPKLIEESIISSSGWSRCQGNRGAAESDSMLLPSSGRHVLRFMSTLNPIINPVNNASNFRVRSFHGSSSLVESHTSSSCPSTAESLFITP